MGGRKGNRKHETKTEIDAIDLENESFCKKCKEVMDYTFLSVFMSDMNENMINADPKFLIFYSVIFENRCIIQKKDV